MTAIDNKAIEAALTLPGEALRDQLGTYLKEHGVDKLAAWSDASKHKNSFAHRLASLGHADALELLLVSRADADVQRESDGCTPLHLALWNGQPAVVERLKALGARQDILNIHGETAQKAEAHRDERYVCWHQQADLLLNVAPLMLRRLFLERWAAFAGPGADIGVTILQGSKERRSVSCTASVRRGQRCVTIEEDLCSVISKGQHIWIRDVELEVAEGPTFSAAEGRWLGGGELLLASSWPRADVRCATLEVQITPPEMRLPPGPDAWKKIRSGRVTNWDMTLLAHFCGEDQCKLACSLVPEVAHREMIRDLKDTRNRAGLHLGRTEVDPQTVSDTADLIQKICDLLVPAMSSELRNMIDGARGKTVIPENMLHQMEQRINEEQERAELMEGRLQTAERFRKHVPPGAFATDNGAADTTADGSQSEWSASRVSTVWKPCGGVFSVCDSIEDVLNALTLPQHCNQEVVLRCLSLAVPCPRERNLLIVIRTADTRVDDIMLQEVSASQVHQKWKERQTSVFSVEACPETFEDWCLPDGVLVSGEQGRVLRVSAQFRPPDGSWRVRSPALKRALNIANAVEAVVVVSELGVLYASSTTHAQHGEYVQFKPSDDSDSDEDVESATVFSSRYTATQVEREVGPSSTAQMVGDFFRPHERGRGQVTETLLPQAAEQARHWGDGSASITAGNAEQVSDNTSKWMWHMYGRSSHAEAMEALQCGMDVLKRLEDGGFHAYLSRLLLPMGEFRRAWGQTKEAEDLFNRCRKLTKEHGDFENGFSAHMSLFNLYSQNQLPLAHAVLASAQRLVDNERENRTGEGMKDFIHAKQVFLSGNVARLVAKEALQSKDSDALLKAQEQLERIDGEMSGWDKDSPFRGNTDANHAELLSLWYIVSMVRGDTESARKSVERELPLRRALARNALSSGESVCNTKLANALVNMGSVLITSGDHDAADSILSEAQDVAQSLMSGPRPPKNTMGHVHRLRARCFEEMGLFNKALVHLQSSEELGDPGALALIRELKVRQKRQELQGHRRRGDSTDGNNTQDSRSIDQLAAFIDGNVGKAGKKSKKVKVAKLAEVKEEDGELEETQLVSEDKPSKADAMKQDSKMLVAAEEEGDTHGEEDAEHQEHEEDTVGADKAKVKKKKPGKKKKR